MNRCKKIPILVCVLLTALNIVACGQVKGDEVVNTDESSTRQQVSSVQTVESINLETEELLDLFINGSISAISSEDSASAFYITDLDMDSDEWDSYSIGEKVDLDNDGENELIICGPYGGIYFDARDNKVYEFAVGEGTGYMLSYVVYHGATWIMYSNRAHAGYELYHMEKFEGADNLVAEMNFSEELIDENNIESGMKYTLNGSEISYDEFEELASRIFATEVSTTSSKNADETDLDGKEDSAYDVLDHLIGKYDYTSEDGTGKLAIQKTSDGYDISDYESESSYRFLADSSNIETIENNKIYIKYPEQVFSDDTVHFSYYILEYDTDSIDVYYGKTVPDEAQFLYHATKQNDKNAEDNSNNDYSENASE